LSITAVEAQRRRDAIRLEFDRHQLDVRLKVVIRDPLGVEHKFKMERVRLLVSIDVCTRVVLGYQLVLAREYPPKSISACGVSIDEIGRIAARRWPNEMASEMCLDDDIH
jgi:hypothetical protein